MEFLLKLFNRNMKEKVKHLLSFLLHGERQPIYAQISLLTPNNRLCGSKIIVTGGSRGIGFAMAKKFVDEGADVLITGRNEESLQKSAEQIKCKYLVLDVQDINSFQSFIQHADEILGGPAWLTMLVSLCMSRISSMLHKIPLISR